MKPTPSITKRQRALRDLAGALFGLLLLGPACADSDSPSTQQGKPVSRSDEQNQREVSKFVELHRSLNESRFVVVDGAISSRDHGTRAGVGALSDETIRKVATQGLQALKGKLLVPDGVGVIVIDDPKRYQIVFGTLQPVGQRGADYTAKVTIDKRSNAVIELLAGS